MALNDWWWIFESSLTERFTKLSHFEIPNRQSIFNNKWGLIFNLHHCITFEQFQQNKEIKHEIRQISSSSSVMSTTFYKQAEISWIFCQFFNLEYGTSQVILRLRSHKWIHLYFRLSSSLIQANSSVTCVKYLALFN